MSKYKRKLYMIVTFFIVLASLQGCREVGDKSSVCDKKYTYTGKTFENLKNDKFTIVINGDGTFGYSESILSSHFGRGTWTIEEEILVLSEDEQLGSSRVNYFRIEGDDIIFLEERSSNFIYVKVKDGERFTGTALGK